jgi:cyclic beta-1,2-glucan synthetase
MEGQGPLDPARTAARDLQQNHATEPGPPRPLPLLSRGEALAAWFEALRRHAADAPPEAAKAAEWLIDNDYVLRRAIRAVRKDMPARFYRDLPRLAAPGFGGLPRVWFVARGALDAVEMQPGLNRLASFVSAYQEGRELAIVELWALPTMLRLACLETLIAACAELFPGLDAPFDVAPRDGWSARMDPTEAVARAITAIAALATLPWKDFFDRTSLVDAALRRDPAGLYAGMDFESRDLYRKAVEDLGRGSGRVETEVVRLALEMSDAQPDDARRGHVGHWLIGSGRAELEGALGYSPPFASRHLRWIRSRARPLYFAVLVLFFLARSCCPWASCGTGAPDRRPTPVASFCRLSRRASSRSP